MMTDYRQLREICEADRKVSAEVVDDYLIYFAAGKNRLDQEMDQRARPYRHILRKFPAGSEEYLKSQYIAHRIFKKDGLIHKYLRYSEMQYLKPAQREYLERMAKYSWRFSFSVIIKNPAENFFEMEDVFSFERYLLYSPGMHQISQESRPLLWFNLISNNGFCRQSFGPIAHYNGFQPDDIYFFATEINPAIGSEEELEADIEKNPVPYMMLLSGSGIPLLFKKEEQIIYMRTACEDCLPDTAALEKDFIVDRASGVTRYGLKRWNVFPHYAHAYHDEQQKLFLLSSMTEKGYARLTGALENQPFSIPPVPDIGVNPAMIAVAEDIFRKKIDLDEYTRLFTEEPSPAEKQTTDQLNELVQMMLPDINAGREPDYDLLAKKSGQDIETIRDLAGHLNKTFKRMGK